MTAFDLHRPPEQEVVDDCVHCGFCLETCPTYVLWGAEADSPRGRIVLVNDGLNRDEPLSDEMVTHFDRCLGCMACVTACPSGVRYDRLIERVRPQVERHHRRTPAERALRRLLFETLPHPKRLRALAPMLTAGRRLGMDRRLPERLAAVAKVAPQAPAGRAAKARVPELTPAVGTPRGRVGLLLGCVQRIFYPGVHRATVHALSAEGFEVVAPTVPDCCGALEFHSGEEPAAVRRAQETIAAFAEAGVDYVVVNAAGCGSAMKEYGDLLDTRDARAFSEQVRDVTELLASVEPRAPARTRAAPRRLPRRLSPRPRPGGAQRPARGVALDSAARARGGRRRARGLLRVGRDLQPRPARGRRRARCPQGAPSHRDGRAGDRRRQPGVRRPA